MCGAYVSKYAFLQPPWSPPPEISWPPELPRCVCLYPDRTGGACGKLVLLLEKHKHKPPNM